MQPGGKTCSTHAVIRSTTTSIRQLAPMKVAQYCFKMLCPSFSNWSAQKPRFNTLGDDSMVSGERSKKKQAEETNGESSDKDASTSMPNKKIEPPTPTRQQSLLHDANASRDYTTKRVTSQYIRHTPPDTPFCKRVYRIADHAAKKRRPRRFCYRKSHNRCCPSGRSHFGHADRLIPACAYVEERVRHCYGKHLRISHHCTDCPT